MTLDEKLDLLPKIAERLERLESRVESLKRRLGAATNGLEAPVYDVDGLRALGYSEREAYAILRSYGAKRNGRLRVTQARLIDYQEGRPSN